MRRQKFCSDASLKSILIMMRQTRLAALESDRDPLFNLENKLRVLLIEDDAMIGAAVQEALKDAAYAAD